MDSASPPSPRPGIENHAKTAADQSDLHAVRRNSLAGGCTMIPTTGRDRPKFAVVK